LGDVATVLLRRVAVLTEALDAVPPARLDAPMDCHIRRLIHETGIEVRAIRENLQ
jgi:hypothetical protein